jgi:DNA-binding SARP family transcriptional activator
MEFRVLGPLEVVDDGRPVAIERRLSRALLAYLLLHANEPMSADRLVDELWGPAAPRTAIASLQNYVSTLRKLLGAGRIELEPAGYVLRVDPERFDLTRFNRLVSEARAAPPMERSQLLRSALALWRGQPLQDLAFEEFAQAEIAELSERHLAAVEERVDADLQLGAGAELVEELAELIAEHPLRERLRGQAMLALYRAGRQADALQAYQDARHILDEELGLEPSEELRDLQQRILRHDPSLAEAAPVPEGIESRRTVTILFCDLVGSTRLATALDPEVYRRLISSYLDAASRAIEAHGGVVEKFIGDAVMAVFGAPELREDDVLRAVRAAVDARNAVAALEAHELAVRIAVNTGEVVVSGSGLVAGATVNLAAHLEQRADVNGIVLGEQTHRLVRDAVRAEPVELGDGLRGWRLDELIAGVPGVTRRFGVPLVGRKQELRRLRAMFQRARSERSCKVVTLVGEPGIGKTRLARELAASVKNNARVLVGNCVAYGAGATYLPLAAIVREAAPEPSVAGIASLLSGVDDAEHIARLVGELTGIAPGPGSPDEAFWAIRRLLEAIAHEQPLVVVLDDVHWAEPTLLDLVEYLGEWAEGPMLIVCLARPDLLERRPGWGGPTSTGFVLQLDPLAAEQVAALVEELSAGVLEPGAQSEIVELAGGNALFAEQLLAFAGESQDTTLERAPPTLEALLASRLELVPRRELSVLRGASVIGRDFSAEEVRTLGAAENADLRALERRGLIHSLPGREGYRFHHVLVRDVAYQGITKAERAELHQQAAETLDRSGATDELVGYHLEQAARYEQELGQPDPALAERASERLGAAGRRAEWRGDTRAAAALLERALELVRPFRLDLHLEVDLAWAYRLSAPEQAMTIGEAAAVRAGGAGDEAGEALARVVAARLRSQVAEDLDVDGLEKLARRAIPLLEQAEDHAGLVHVWYALGYGVANFRCQFEEWAHAARQALRHARLAGQQPRHLFLLEVALVLGPTPADEALRVLDAALPENASPGSLLMRARLLAMLGCFDQAWPLAHEANARLRELTGGDTSYALADIAGLAGDHEAAAGYLRTLCDWCETHGQRLYLSSAAPALGRSLCELGRYSEAEPLARLGRELGNKQDLNAQMRWREVEALVHASRGEHAQAEQLARDAVTLSERTDGLNFQGDALCNLAEVLHMASRSEEAAGASAGALERYERKRNLAVAERVRARTGLRPMHAPAERA